MMYFAEYMQAGSGIPVDVTIGTGNKANLIKHARKVSTNKGYNGFWISSKPEGVVMDPKRLEFHEITYSPGGKALFHKPLLST